MPLPRMAAAVVFFLSIQKDVFGAGGVVADGGTATNVTTAPNGHQTVNLAPTVSGVSHNTYSQFNVGAPGVDLNNVGVNARNIVNQVTSTNPSLIQGAVTVLGPRANVIIANPNGITVNGGSFINTGNVALTTGQVSFNDFTIAPGQTQRNIVLTTSQGVIEIGPGGLAGAMLNLELIAKNVKVNGPVLNSFSNPNAGVRIAAGDSTAEIDGSVSPTDNLTPWVNYSTSNTSNPGATVIDITPLGSLTAGRIELVITDQGAAVKHAGSMYANAGDFVVTGNGDLKITGGSIQSAGNTVVASSGLTVQGGDNGKAQLTAAGTIGIFSTAVSIADAQLRAGMNTVNADGSINVTQSGDIRIGVSGQTTTTATTIGNANFAATGGIGIYNQNNAVNLTGSAFSAYQNLLLDAQSVEASTQWQGNTAQSTSLTSQTGTVTLNADALALNGAKVNGMAGVNVSANSFMLTASHGADGSAIDRALLASKGAGIAIQTGGDTRIAGSDVLAASDLVVHSRGFSSISDGASGSTVVAVNGGVLIDSTADITNIGSLIQGSTRITGNAASLGAITLNAGGNILNESPSETLLGAIFGKSDDVALHASGNITNHSARILTNTALTLQAQGDVQNIIDKQAGANQEQAVISQSQGRRWLILTENSSSFDIDYGKVMPNQLAYLVSGTGMTIQGNNVINRGGEIDANNGNINITASNLFQNEALFDGSAHYSSKCLLFCRSSASSTVQSHGGLISASNDVNINAGAEASNVGGRVLALNNLTVTAPKTYATGVMGYTSYERDSGVKAWFGDTWARLYAMDIGGSWSANSGLVTIHGQAILNGGSFDGAAGVDASGGTLVIRMPKREPVTIQNHLGAMHSLWN